MMLSQRQLAGTCRAGRPTQSALVYKPVSVRLNALVVPARARITSKAQQQDALQVEEGPQGLRGPETLVLPTIFAKSPASKELLKANVVLPATQGVQPVPQEGDSVRVAARGVVLFLHGFAQGPTAYARMLSQLAAANDVVVVAPCPPFGATPEKQQTSMVESALFWRDLIARDQLPGLTLAGGTAESVGLLGHSVGGGLAAFVVDGAAKRGQAFTAAQVLAPQTSKVVEQYRYDTAAGGKLLQGVDTQWCVQYGLIDLLSSFPSVDKFRDWLRAKGRLTASVKYPLGTHVGFEDQLVVGRESFTTNFLPWVLAVLWGAMSLWLPLLGLRTLSKLQGDAAVPAAATPGGAKKGVEGSIPASEGFGVPDDVELPDERVMLAGYLALASTVTAIEAAIPGFAWDNAGEVGLSVLKGVFLLLAIGSWPSVVAFPYEAIKQRPESRRQVAQYFERTLVRQKESVRA